MSKKYYRFFGGLLQKQEEWLNKMAEQGYQLIRVDKMMYEFEECNPDRAEYRVEYIGSKFQNDSQEYFQFLEDMGYRVFQEHQSELLYWKGEIPPVGGDC